MRAAAIGVALAGLGIATYLTAVHYAGGEPVCAVAHGCATVQQSDYAALAGVPVAVLGLLGYLGDPRRARPRRRGGRTAAAFLSLAGLGLLGLADLRRGRRPGRDLHLVRRLGDLHGAARRADGRADAGGAGAGMSVQMAPVGERLRDPVLWTDVSQIVKTVAAAVIAWVIAHDVLGIAQPFLAPWAALLTVHATVYRTLARGVQQVGATVLGVLLAFAAGAALGVNAAVARRRAARRAWWPARTRRLRAESTTAAATALVVLLTGYAGRLPDAARAAARHRDRHRRRAARSTCWCGRRCTTAPPRAASTGSTTGSARCSATWRRGCARAASEDDAEEWVERTRDIEHEDRRSPGRPSGRRARAAGSTRAAARGRARRRLRGLRGAARAARAGRRRDAQHGAHDGRLRGLAAATGTPTFRERSIDLLGAHRPRRSREADVEGVAQVREDVEAAARSLSGRRRRSLLRPSTARCWSTCATSPTRWATSRAPSPSARARPDPRRAGPAAARDRAGCRAS